MKHLCDCTKRQFSRLGFRTITQARRHDETSQTHRSRFIVHEVHSCSHSWMCVSKKKKTHTHTPTKMADSFPLKYITEIRITMIESLSTHCSPSVGMRVLFWQKRGENGLKSRWRLLFCRRIQFPCDDEKKSLWRCILSDIEPLLLHESGEKSPVFEQKSAAEEET